MAQLALSVAGAVVGNLLLPGLGGQIGFALGSYIGAGLGGGSRHEGPRLESLKVQTSTYGTPIPHLFGTVRSAGAVIWSADLEEVATETEVGGKGGPSQTSVVYSYYGTFAVLLGADVGSAIVSSVFASGSNFALWASPLLIFAGYVIHSWSNELRPHNLGRILIGLGLMLLSLNLGLFVLPRR